jgi:RimJ/RimL family protein N-acetyltransferase
LLLYRARHGRTLDRVDHVTFVPIETERLTLRPVSLADAQDLAERRSDPLTAHYQGWTTPYSLVRAEELIQGCLALSGPTPGSWYEIIIVERATGRIVGDVAAELSANGKTATIGYTLHAWARGLGYATEAARALCTYLVESVGVHRLAAETHPDNVASIRVLERLGFAAEGIRRESYWVDDVVSDDAMFGMLARDWVTTMR